jgi:monoamine oxidase
MAAVLVIGAGAAGLAAARDLRSGGASVLVLEARDAIGGRIRTVRDEGWPVLEAGAEFVHGAPHPLVRRIHPELVSGKHWYARKGKITRGGGALWEAVQSLLAEAPPEETSFAASVAARRLPARVARPARALALEYVKGFHAADPGQASALALSEQTRAEAEEGGDTMGRVPQGYDRLIELLARNVEIVRGAVVHSIEWRRGSVAALARSQLGARLGPFRAEAAVVTLPVSVLARRSVHFRPALPARKLAALRGLAMGPVVKVALRFRERFFERILPDLEMLHVPGTAFPAWWSLRPLEAPVLVGWAAGPRARALRGDPVRGALRTLEQATGVALERLVDGSRVFDWRDEPFCFGAYSWVKVGGLGAQDRLAEPVEETLFFAGEATHRTWNGTVQGALESGERAAREVLAALG